MLPVDTKTPCTTISLEESDKLFFSESPKRIAKAVALCQTCPAKNACLTHALKNDCEFGVFGGYTPQERKAMKP